MSERGFRRTPGGVCWLGLHLAWCPKYRRRPGDLPEQIAGEHWLLSYFAASVGCVSESTVRRYFEQQWDAVAS